MKRKRLLRAALALAVCMAGGLWPSEAKADTNLLSSSDGWEKVTSLSDVANYFYVIVDNSNDLMVGLNGTQISYQTSQNPVADLNKVWSLESSGSSYGMRNISNSKLLLQTEWNQGWNINLNDQPNVCEWTNLIFAYANGVWTIENGKYPYVDESSSDASPYSGYLGPWDGAGTQANGKRIAGNKNKANHGTFQIYRIPRSRFLSLYIAANTAPVDVSFYVAGLTNSTSAWTRNYSGFDKNYQPQRSNGKNTDAYSNWGFLESWNNGVTFTGTLTATLNNLPDGIYDIGAYCFKETGDMVSFTAGEKSVALASDNNKYQYVSINSEEVTYEGTNANTKTIGFNITGATWIGITDVRLIYHGPAKLSDIAVALPDNGDMAAGIWYYMDIAVAGDYAVTAQTLADIVYTTDGNHLKKNGNTVTTSFSSNNTFSANRYYVKSSSGNNLVFSLTDVYLLLQAALATYAPYSDVTDATGYTDQYNIFKNYTESTSQSDMQAAIDYMTAHYADYKWANASIEHPVDVTEGIISGWECTSNDAWPGSGRTTATGTYYDGSSRTYFTQNHEDGAARTQSVTIPKVGAYLLRTIVRPVADASYATISIGDESTTTKGKQTGVADIGNGWAYNDIYFATTAANASKTISIALSNVNNSREADCGEMHLLYIGQSADFVKDGVHRYIGSFATAPTIELTDAVSVANITAATMSGATLTFTNPNGLVFAKTSSQVNRTDKNVVVDGTCASLQLVKGRPFVNPTSFTATSASYTVSDNDLAGNKFATLMLPFAVASVTDAYVLDQGVDLIGGALKGTKVTSIEANKPVLVTKTGSYSGSGVTVPAVAAGQTFTNGELVGVYQNTSAPQNSYVLQNHTSGEGVAFYLVGSTKPQVGPFRAYIKPQDSNVKAISVMFDEDGIQTMDNGQWTMDNAEIFNLSGQRLSKPQRGVNIINGKKVVVK